MTDRACIAPFFSDLDISTCDIVSVTYVCVCVYVCVHTCVRVCVYQRERDTHIRTHAHTRTERERAIVRERERVREGGRARKNKHVRHILCYKMYKMLDGMKHHTQSQSMFTFCLIKPYQPFNPNKDIHNTQSNHIFTQREREYKKKVKACLGLETFTANFCPSWGFFKACLVGLTDSCKTQFDYKICHIFAHDIHSR